jgi:hypothetical protein
MEDGRLYTYTYTYRMHSFKVTSAQPPSPKPLGASARRPTGFGSVPAKERVL